MTGGTRRKLLLYPNLEHQHYLWLQSLTLLHYMAQNTMPKYILIGLNTRSELF